VTKVSLVLGSLLVLDMVMVSVAPHLWQECVYLVVTLSIVVVVVEPTHDDDVCMYEKCAGGKYLVPAVEWRGIPRLYITFKTPISKLR
jgi:hypothetical protein